MGWVSSPPNFCAWTETVCDMANADLKNAESMRKARVTPHRLDVVSETGPVQVQPPNKVLSPPQVPVQVHDQNPVENSKLAVPLNKVLTPLSNSTKRGTGLKFHGSPKFGLMEITIKLQNNFLPLSVDDDGEAAPTPPVASMLSALSALSASSSSATTVPSSLSSSLSLSLSLTSLAMTAPVTTDSTTPYHTPLKYWDIFIQTGVVGTHVGKPLTHRGEVV